MKMLARMAACTAVTMVFVRVAAAQTMDITFTTDFGFNGRHSYFFVALDKGFYKAEGLNVNIIRGQGSIDAVKKVATGAAQIGFADAGAVILARANDSIPVKLVAIIYAKPPHAVFALADSGIKTPKDLEGRTVADAPFARPFGIPDGFIAAGMYGVLIVLAFFNPQTAWIRYSIRGVALLAALANGLGVIDMARFGAYCSYCLLTTLLAPLLVWMAFLF